MAKVLSGRVDEDLAAWVEAYADERGVSRSAVLEAALKGLREDAKSGVPDLPKPERVPTPQQKGTDHWREPTQAEIASARERHPDLPLARLQRLARAEARLADMGLPAAPASPSADEPADLEKGVPRQGGDFSRLTHARGEFFADLKTPESITGKVSTKTAYGRS